MIDTIFKPGVEYRTRDGRRARVYATDGNGNQSIHGAFWRDDCWQAVTWLPSGKWCRDGREEGIDLMPPGPAKERFMLWGAPSETGRDTVLEVEIQPDGTLKAVR